MSVTSRLALLKLVRGPQDVILALRIFGIAVAAPVFMRLPLPRVQTLLEPRRRPPYPDLAVEARIVNAVLAVLRAGRPLVRRGCLTRGVTLYYFLRRAGVPVTLCFGLGASAEQADGYDGHCWLAKDGEPFLEPRDPRPLYTELYSFPFSHTRHTEVDASCKHLPLS